MNCRGQSRRGARPHRRRGARRRPPGRRASRWSRSARPSPQAAVRAALAAGQRVFGENRVQEALAKFPQLRGEFPDLALHLIGPLQTNKVQGRGGALRRDRDASTGRGSPRRWRARWSGPAAALPCYIEVNTGEEPQKAGILPADADDFIRDCRDRLGLPIDGLMCIPPERRGAGAAFRAAARDRAAQRPRRAQHGDERRFRDRDPLRRDPCPGRHRDLRRAARRRGEAIWRPGEPGGPSPSHRIPGESRGPLFGALVCGQVGPGRSLSSGRPQAGPVGRDCGGAAANRRH